MAKNIYNVEKLLNELTQRISEQGSTEMDKIIAFKRKKTGNPKAEFNSWDTSFYMSRYDEEVGKVDESKLSEYFPADRVIAQT